MKISKKAKDWKQKQHQKLSKISFKSFACKLITIFQKRKQRWMNEFSSIPLYILSRTGLIRNIQVSRLRYRYLHLNKHSGSCRLRFVDSSTANRYILLKSLCSTYWKNFNNNVFEFIDITDMLYKTFNYNKRE